MDRRIRQRQEPQPVPSSSSAKGDYIPQSRAYYDDNISSMITKHAAEGRSFVNQGHATGRRALGKTQSLPANLFSASLNNSAHNTLREATESIQAELHARDVREVQPYAGYAPPPRDGGHDASNPFHNAPLGPDAFQGDTDWDNEFVAAAAATSSPPGGPGGAFAPTMAASPTRPSAAAAKKRTHERSEAENQEALDEVADLRDSMNMDQSSRQFRAPRRLRPTASLPTESFGNSMGF